MTTAQVHRAFWTALLAGTGMPTLLAAQDSGAPQTTPLPSPSAFHFEHIDTQDGLSNNIVFSVYQDREGYLWLGTNDGLNRYDGYTFTIYRHDRDDPASLSNNTVRRVLEDPYGNLWVRTMIGWGRFDRKTGQFFHRGPWPDSFPPYPPGSLAGEDRHFWINHRDGIYRYDPDRDALRLVLTAAEADYPAIEHDQSWAPYQNRRGTIWFGTEEGLLYRYVPATGAGTRFVSPWRQLYVRFEDEQGRLWMNHNLGTGTFDPATQTFAPTPEPIARRHVLLRDRQGFLWITAEHGLYRYQPATRQNLFIALDPPPLQNNIWGGYEDQVGALWIYSLNGVYRFDPHAKPFAHHAHTPQDAAGLSHNTVMAVLESRDGARWVGTLGGGLNRIDPRTGAVTVYRHRAEEPHSLCHDGLWSLLEDRRGTLWVGADRGLCALDPHTGRFRAYRLPLSATWPYAYQPAVNAVREDTQGRLWIGTNDGLHRLDPATGRSRHYAHVFDDPEPYAEFIQSLHLGADDGLWVGTSDSRLYRFDTRTETITVYPALQAVMPVANEGLLTIYEDRAGVLWLGSDRGLTRFDPATGAAHHYTQQDGLPASSVYAILEDDARRLWVSTNNGLARFTDRYPAPPAFRTYDLGDGLENAEFNRRAAFKSAQGAFFFGGMNGLTSFEPDQIKDNPYRPPVVLTAIQTYNRDTTVAVIPYGLDHLVLSYRDYTVSFEFAALNFTNPAQNRYAYQLEGFDNGWIDAGTRRRVQYTNIPPGAYTFRVKAANNDGLWNEAGVALRLTVTPPFWQTWWFRAITGLLLLAAVIALVRYLSTRTLRERIRALETQRQIQHERERISRDLHDHVGAQVSNIISGIELINLTTRAGKGNGLQAHLKALDEDARRTMAQLRETIWTLHRDAVSLEELAEQLRRYAHSRQRYRARPAVHCTVNGDPAVRLSPVQALSLFRIAQEALSNALKHADAAHVYLSVETKARGLIELTVRDDGTFQEPTPGDGLDGYGLPGMERRARELGGTFALTTNDGPGTTVRVSIPVR